MNACTELALENSSASKRWVIGPLFQSFKSKMASFSEIVMCPVKLLTGNSPVPSIRSPPRAQDCEPQPDATSQPGDVFYPETQPEDGNLKAQDKKLMLRDKISPKAAKKVSVKYVKKLLFDVDSEQTDECAISPKDGSEPTSVPSHHSHSPFVVSEEVSESVSSENASRVEPKSKAATTRPKPLARKCVGSRKKASSKSVASGVGEEKCSTDVGDELVASVTSSSSWSEASSACSEGCDQDARTRLNSSDLVRQSLRNHAKDSGPGRTLAPAPDTLQLEQHPSTESDSPAGEKRELAAADWPAQDSVKRKKLAADKCQKAKQGKDSVNVTSKGSKPPKKDVIVSVETSVHVEQTVKPARKRAAAPKKPNKKAPEAVLDAQTECSDVICGVLESKQKGSNKAVKPKRPKIQPAALLQPAAQSQPGLLLDVLLRPDIKQTRKIPNKKPQKRKVPQKESSATDLDQTPVPALTTAQSESQRPGEEGGGGAPGPNPAPKRPRKAARGTVRGTKQTLLNFPVITKEKQAEPSAEPPSPRTVSGCVVNLGMDVLASVAGEVFLPCQAPPRQNGAARTPREGSRARWVNAKPRRRSRAAHGRHGDELSMEDGDASDRSSSRRLLRSYSCPEIPSLHPLDGPWTCSSSSSLSLASPPQSRPPASSPQQPPPLTPLVHNGHRSPRRARRHTVCSVEVEREIAPLCLRKEVYPSRRSFPYDHASSPSLAPACSLSALASCFLSSPLAFLSKKADGRASPAAPGSLSHLPSPPGSSPSCSSPWRLPGFLQRADATSASMDSSSR